MPETISVPLPIPELRPNPDPTDRTISQLQREIGMLQAVIEQRLDGFEKLLFEKDKAILLLQTQMDREPKPPVLESQIAHVAETTDRHSANVEIRFAERDKRIEQRINDGKDAAQATINALKETLAAQHTSSQNAIAKSETATQKQMDQIESKFGTEIGAIRQQIDDAKTRITTLESMKAGMKEQKEDFGARYGLAIGGISTIVALVTVAILVFNNASRINNQPNVVYQERPITNGVPLQ